jgi:hypothetical protein
MGRTSPRGLELDVVIEGSTPVAYAGLSVHVADERAILRDWPMRRFLLALSWLLPLACVEGPVLPAAGEPCDAEGQCAAGLDCVRLICVDDRGPSLRWNLPEQSNVFIEQPDTLVVEVQVEDAADGDQVEIIVDPGHANPQRELLPIVDGSAQSMLTLTAPFAVGPHHLRGRIVDAGAQPHPNPSASKDVVVFVRDPEIPDTPQIAVAWPPTGYQHKLGNPLEIELAIFGDFTLVDSGPTCRPLSDCEPAFGSACEGDCGPVSREGHIKIFTQPDYPECLLDLPVGCNGTYVWDSRGDQAELLGNHVRAVLNIDPKLSPGEVPLQAALAYNNHHSYPDYGNVIYDAITLNVIE